MHKNILYKKWLCDMCGLSTVYMHILDIMYTYLLYEFTTIINVSNMNKIRPHIFHLKINQYNFYLNT